MHNPRLEPGICLIFAIIADSDGLLLHRPFRQLIAITEKPDIPATASGLQ